MRVRRFGLILLFVLAVALRGIVGAQQPPLAQARQLMAQQDFAGAAEILRRLTTDEPDNAQAWLTLGAAALRGGWLDESIAASRKAAAFEATRPAALYALGQAQAQKGDADAAIDRLVEARATGRRDTTAAAFDPLLAPLVDHARFGELFPSSADFEAPFVEEARILREWRGVVVGGQFGWIARNIGDVDGDGLDDAAASAPTDSTAGTNAGAVHAYASGSGAELWRVDGPPGSQLGTGLDAAGDVNADGVPDVIAGAPGAGRALVLSGRDGSTLLELGDGDPAESFGAQVGDARDVDGDGHDDVLVGAPGNGEAGAGAGKAYLFSGRDGALLWQALGQPGEAFGSVVAGATHGGSAWIIAGAPGAGGGRAYVFRGPGQEPAFVIESEASGRQLGAMFASVVGDVDGDGDLDLYVSDWADADKGPSTGKIYVHSGRDGRRLHLLAGQASGDGFGIGPADAGDVDGDGHADLIVGAWRHATAAAAAGRVYLYSGRTGELLWQLTSKVMGETFGFDATGIGDIDGDGAADFLLTSAWSSVNGPRTGRVFIVAGPGLR